MNRFHHAVGSSLNTTEPPSRSHRSRESAASGRARSTGLAGVSRLAQGGAAELAGGDGPVDTNRVQQGTDVLVETICARGCKVVHQVIASLQAGEKLAEMAHLDTPATLAVLAELESIMAVYAENGSVCLSNGK